MQLIHSEDHAQVYHGDGLEWTGEVDAIITDPPYSERTHRGHNAQQSGDGAKRRGIDYRPWSPDDVRAAVEAWHQICRGWICVLTDHVLARSWEAELLRAGRYVFPPVPSVVHGSRVRLAGDGPSNITVWTVVARSRNREYARWGTLPGVYDGPREPQHVVGGKPLWLMRQLVSDYSRVGRGEWAEDRGRSADTVLDPCCGGGTTLVAAKMLGRAVIGIDIDPEHCRISAERLRETRQLPLPIAAPPPEQLEIGGSK